MDFYFFHKQDDPDNEAFREIALYHNVRTSKLLAGTIGVVGLVLALINQYTNATQVLMYPNEYYAAILFIFISSCVCYFAFIVSKKISSEIRTKAYQFFTNFYALIVVVSSLWITFVMQHNPSNTMSIFVLGILSVASLWIFGTLQTIAIALLILILFDGGLHYFQTDSCKLFTNYITGTCVSVFFVCISRVNFSINYKHFKQLKKIEGHSQEIVKVNEMQTEILTVVAHDLRAPINSIIALTDLLRNPERTAAEKNEYYDMIIATCKKSNHIVEDLLQVARNNERDTAIIHTCMNDFIGHIVNQLIKSGNYKREIVYKQPPVKIYAGINHQKMQRVFENLVSNAVKFTNDKGIIEIELMNDANNVCILITDNGIGIPKDLVPLLFNRFTKAGRTGLKGERSQGLGLSICKLIMKQHHGDISVFSEEGKGTQIMMILPQSVIHSPAHGN